MRSAGGLAEVAPGDLAGPEVAARAVKAANQHFGRLDGPISNTGFADRTPFADLTNDALVRSIEAIHGAFFRLAVAALPHPRSSGAGSVVAVFSFVARAFRPGLPTFPAAAAKAGQEALVRALSEDLGRPV